MAQIATKDFIAYIGGNVYALKEGEEFTGTRHASVLLKEQGLIEERKPSAKKGEQK